MQYRLPQHLFPEDPQFYSNSDDRPNTGLREGAIPHLEVNDTIRANPKTVIFGQQTRLRNGQLTPDEKLPRFHAGHDMVKFFYSSIRQLPPYLVDALLDNNVSVTLVQGPSLLVFHHAREHQSFHVGRTRHTLYIPEMVLREAFEKGYDYWAISEIIIQESWPLLNYLLIYETVRRLQDHLKTHYTIGYYIIKDHAAAAQQTPRRQRRQTRRRVSRLFSLLRRRALQPQTRHPRARPLRRGRRNF